MIIFPPEELLKYITLDESGKWICAENMPEELFAKFEEFEKNVDAAKQYQTDMQ